MDAVTELESADPITPLEKKSRYQPLTNGLKKFLLWLLWPFYAPLIRPFRFVVWVLQPVLRPLGRLRKFINSPGFIWWMLEQQRAWWKQLLAFTGFLIMFRAVGFTTSQSVIMVVSMFLHELGHAYFFRVNGIKHVIRYLFPLGAVAAPANKEENERSDLLRWYNLALLLLGGPAVNIALMVVGRGLIEHTDVASLQKFGFDLLYVNGVLAFMNLIPFKVLDAGQLFKLVYSSLNERHDRNITIGFTIVTAVIIGYVMASAGLSTIQHLLFGAFTNWSLLAFSLVFVMSIWHTQAKDNPEHHTSIQRLTRNEMVISLGLFFAMVYIGLAMTRFPVG